MRIIPARRATIFSNRTTNPTRKRRPVRTGSAAPSGLLRAGEKGAQVWIVDGGPLADIWGWTPPLDPPGLGGCVPTFLPRRPEKA